MTTERAFLMVWDGLRPDFVSPELTPNLWRLAEEGVWFERSHAVYPTVTRANSPAISTGCRPGRAGIPGNTFCLPASGSVVQYTTGDASHLKRLAEADGSPILLVDTLADRVHRADGKTVVVGTGSPGCTTLQHPRAVEYGDPVIASGLSAMGPVMQQGRTRFGPPPERRVPATDWDAYFTRISTEHVVPELDPTLFVFWHTDPDHTTHSRGHAARETRQALHDADENLGAILDTYDRLGLRKSTAVMVTSDHGTSTVTRRVRPAHDLSALVSNLPVAESGGSVFVYSSDPTVVHAIRQLDYVGPVFTRDGREQTFPLSLVGLDGPRAPDIVFSLAWHHEEIDGFAGSAVGSSSNSLAVDHGTISPFDLRNTLVAQGPDFRIGWHDPAPVGNIDVAPTLAHLLRLDSDTPFEGRVLAEALRDGSPDVAWDSHEQAVSFAARRGEWVQRVLFEQVGTTIYVAGGAVEPA